MEKPLHGSGQPLRTDTKHSASAVVQKACLMRLQGGSGGLQSCSIDINGQKAAGWRSAAAWCSSIFRAVSCSCWCAWGVAADVLQGQGHRADDKATSTPNLKAPAAATTEEGPGAALGT